MVGVGVDPDADPFLESLDTAGEGHLGGRGALLGEKLPRQQLLEDSVFGPGVAVKGAENGVLARGHRGDGVVAVVHGETRKALEKMPNKFRYARKT